MSSKKIRMTIIVDEETADKVKKEADLDRRSASGMVAKILRKHFEAEGQGDKQWQQNFHQ